MANDRRRTVRNLVIFACAVIASAILGAAIEPHTLPPDAGEGAQGLGMLLWLVTPLAVSLLLRAVGGDGWSDLGLRPNLRGNGLWWLASLLLFPAVLTILIAVGVGLRGLVLDRHMAGPLGAAILAGLLPALLKNVFEEFTWRGYLAPKVYSLKLNIWLSHAIVGLIWGAWHIPFLYALVPYLEPQMMPWFAFMLLLGTVSQSVVYGEIRLATDSVLPAWIMHTIGNAIASALLASSFITMVPGWAAWVSPGAESVVSIVLMLGAGMWLHRRRTATAGTNASG